MTMSPLCREELLATPNSFFQLGGYNQTGGLWNGMHDGAHMYMYTYCYVHVHVFTVVTLILHKNTVAFCVTGKNMLF